MVASKCAKVVAGKGGEEASEDEEDEAPKKSKVDALKQKLRKASK